MRRKIGVAGAVLVCGLAAVGKGRVGLSLPTRLNLSLGTLSGLLATPGTINFQAINPDSGQVSGSSPGSINWNVSSGSHTQNWTLSVQSGSSTFGSCPTIPVSAVRVSCSSASVPGTGGTAVCSGSFPLSTTPQQVAGGAEADGASSYSVSMNFTLAESWRYVANSGCTLTLTYSVNAP